MVLTRTMKELWLFGGLDTIPHDNEQDAAIRKQMDADEQALVQGFLDLIAQSNTQNDSTTNASHTKVKDTD